MSKLLKGIGAALPVVGSVLGGIFNANSQKKQNERSERFSREMYAQQRSDSLSDWNMQNAYNDPSAQMQRLKDANLNPNLVYGNGADAQMGAPMRSSQAAQPDFKAPQVDAGGIVQSAMMMKQIQSNIAKTDAETAAIKARTVGSEFQNQLNQAIGLEQMKYHYDTAVNKASTQTQRELLEFEAQLTAGLGDPRNPNSPAVKALKAGYQLAEQELKNAIERGDAMASETAIKKYEANLTKQGFSPNSPFYLKAVISLLNKAGINLE